MANMHSDYPRSRVLVYRWYRDRCRFEDETALEMAVTVDRDSLQHELRHIRLLQRLESLHRTMQGRA